ncbi:unnamed protein product, partial [Meganyctiphanes norvegica]
TLFNVIMSDIPHTNSFIIREYADDIAIIITADTLEEAHTRTQTAITELETWANRWCLKFNSNKTKSLCFTKKRIGEILQDPTLQLKLNQETIEWVKSVRYLGVTLDAPTLTWKKHYEQLTREGQQRINIMRAISGTTWGSKQRTPTQLLQELHKKQDKLCCNSHRFSLPIKKGNLGEDPKCCLESSLRSQKDLPHHRPTGRS